MTNPAFDLNSEVLEKTLCYRIFNSLWDRFTFVDFDISFSNWTKIKYYNDTVDGLNDSINLVPNNNGGIYLFYVKCNILAGISEYPVYIGRARLTDNQNLRKRVKEYHQLHSKIEERPRIKRMIDCWAKDLHLAYIAVDGNEIIDELEKQLINSLLLPMNDQIPDKEVSRAIKAFS